MSIVIDLADAIVAELAAAPAGTFNQAIDPQRRVLPQFELAELDELKVTVVPKAVDISNASRVASQYDVQVDIGVQKRVSKTVDADVEDLFDLVDEIYGFLQRRQLATLQQAIWLRTANSPIYSPEQLSADRVFTSVLTVTYRLIRQ